MVAGGVTGRAASRRMFSDAEVEASPVLDG
jgi:hypothetical protein